MRHLLALCALLLWAGPAALAQDAGSPSADPVPTTVSTTIEQVVPNVGGVRVLDVLGIGRGSFEGRSLTDALDLGGIDGNVAQILQEGDGNTTLLQQFGGQNVASLRLLGDDNVITATQLNGYNTLDLLVDGSGNDIPVLQNNLFGRGNDLTLSLIGFDNVALPVPITQVGALGQPIEITVRRAGN